MDFLTSLEPCGFPSSKGFHVNCVSLFYICGSDLIALMFYLYQESTFHIWSDILFGMVYNSIHSFIFIAKPIVCRQRHPHSSSSSSALAFHNHPRNRNTTLHRNDAIFNGFKWSCGKTIVEHISLFQPSLTHHVIYVDSLFSSKHTYMKIISLGALEH